MVIWLTYTGTSRILSGPTDETFGTQSYDNVYVDDDGNEYDIDASNVVEFCKGILGE